MQVKIIGRRISLSFSLFRISQVKTRAALSSHNVRSLLIAGLYQSYVVHLMTNLTHNSFLYMFISVLYMFSTIQVLIIRRFNCINTISGICHSK